ncbi:transcriptional regulator, LysR family [Formosa agariphila KMM 3901]|uniref:Transcriptional regulator, LysR family n=1 Tax=Formosa agariphila (strain DSM 15362 / KCTC 12365 / LMG 23005 / KMM 3901 / M-2Alg 35-1) TaxID=1347342 RepID=T2KHD7_FORAG|nr:LysR family transcriptional regulator [Formosa agariphila]CDF77811.1 transcriptional regulator, LysR family [Formosa agariphila KMM 3901]
MNVKFKIFKEVALNLSFTKSAEILNLSQPAVSKTIRTLEDTYKKTFFIRLGNNIELTPDGLDFLEYAEKILALHAELDNHFLTLEQDEQKLIKFGASTTLADYILPQILAKSEKNTPNTTVQLISGNTDYIEHLITGLQLDFGIIEGSSHNKQLQYEKFIKDEIVLVTSANNPKFKTGMLQLKDLEHLPMVEREHGSGTREIIYKKLNEYGIKQLKSNVTLHSTVAIKNYLYHSKSYALLSIHSISDDLLNNKLKVIDIQNFNFERWFYFVSRQGFQSKTKDFFEKLIKLNHN